MCGFLSKKSGRVVFPWQKRWFTLTGHYLKWSEKEEEEATSAIDCNTLASVRRAGKSVVLTVRDGEAEIELRSDSVDAATRWANAVQSVDHGLWYCSCTGDRAVTSGMVAPVFTTFLSQGQDCLFCKGGYAPN